jgi:hypothetical protein
VIEDFSDYKAVDPHAGHMTGGRTAQIMRCRVGQSQRGEILPKGMVNRRSGNRRFFVGRREQPTRRLNVGWQSGPGAPFVDAVDAVSFGLPNFFQQRNCKRRQGNPVRHPVFCFGGRNCPNIPFRDIEFRLFGGDDFAFPLGGREL